MTKLCFSRPTFPQGLLAEGLALAVIRVVNILLGVLTVSMFARWMGADEYGRYVLVISLALLFSLPLHMGLPTLLTREVAAASAAGSDDICQGLLIWSLRLIITTTTVLLGGGMLIGGLIWLGGWWQPLAEDLWVMGLAGGVAIALALQQRSIGILRGKHHQVLSQLPEGLLRPVILLALGALVLHNWDTDYRTVLAVYFFASVLSTAVGIALMRAVRPAGFAKLGHETIRSRWFRDLLPFTIIAGIATLNRYTDIILLGMLRSSAEVAYYKVATLVGLLPLTLHGISINMLMPRAAAAWEKGDIERLAYLGRRVSQFSFAGVLLYAVAFMLVGPRVLDFIFGPEYAGIYRLVLVLLLVPLLSTFAGSALTILNMSSYAGITARIAAVAALSNVVFGLILIPTFGVMGAAMSSIVATAVISVLSWWLVQTKIGLRCDIFA